jgi:hypothetical protein
MSSTRIEEGKDGASRIVEYIHKLQDDLNRGVKHSRQNQNKEVTGDTQQKQKHLEDLFMPCEVATKQHHGDLGVDSDLASKQQQ